MRTKSLFYSLSVILVLAMLLALPAPVLAAGKPPPVEVQILAINDFHGALDPSTVRVTRNPDTFYYAGGAEYLSTMLKEREAPNLSTVKVTAGDSVGASPLLSALFHDEPTIQALNLMGFDFSATGNHEFDEGWQELLRLQYGGCHPVDGCFLGKPDFKGADFEYLSANVFRLDTGETLFPAYSVRNFKGVKVAFIGVALESTPSIVVPAGVEGLDFAPEVEAINATVQMLKEEKGIKAFVVLLHDGSGAAPSFNSCNYADPFISTFVMQIDPEVDVLITGHTHNPYNCEVTVSADYGPMRVTSAGTAGRYFTDIDLLINRTDGQVASISAENVEVVDGPVSGTPVITATPDPAMTELLAAYREVAGPIANRVIGSITAAITRSSSAAGESALGDVIADAQLAATILPEYGGAVVAMTNPGGIRTDLTYPSSAAGEGDGNVTYGEAFAVQPFSNSLVTLTLTGAQLKAVLEQQVFNSRMLQISASLTYSWSASAAAGNHVSNLMINGVAVDPAASYRVTVNNFLAGGGDGFTALLGGTDLLTGMIDLDAFVAYLTANSPVAPGPQNRITVIP